MTSVAPYLVSSDHEEDDVAESEGNDNTNLSDQESLGSQAASVSVKSADEVNGIGLPLPFAVSHGAAEYLRLHKHPLREAISTIDPARLRQMVKELCFLDKYAEDYFVKHMIDPNGSTNRKRKQCDELEPGAPYPAKRMALIAIMNPKGANERPLPRLRYERCGQCNNEYDVRDNHSKACRWHTDEREVNEDSSTWYDWDENCHGIIDQMEDEYPQGFIWVCCDKIGTDPGCRRGPHRPR